MICINQEFSIVVLGQPDLLWVNFLVRVLRVKLTLVIVY